MVETYSKKITIRFKPKYEVFWWYSFTDKMMSNKENSNKYDMNAILD